MSRPHTRRRSYRRNRRGSMLMEFAVCLPILLLFFFGLWEYSRMEMIRQTVRAAAFEGARQGIVDGANTNEMEETAQDWLAAFSVRQGTIDSSLSDAEARVTITVPLLPNSYAATIFNRDTEITSTITLVRESFGG